MLYNALSHLFFGHILQKEKTLRIDSLSFYVFYGVIFDQLLVSRYKGYVFKSCGVKVELILTVERENPPRTVSAVNIPLFSFR